ncbi:MAG: hypothetical protein WAL86_16370, partial [Candidatus Acidiferrales bacterium]
VLAADAFRSFGDVRRNGQRRSTKLRRQPKLLIAREFGREAINRKRQRVTALPDKQIRKSLHLGVGR